MTLPSQTAQSPRSGFKANAGRKGRRPLPIIAAGGLAVGLTALLAVVAVQMMSGASEPTRNADADGTDAAGELAGGVAEHPTPEAAVKEPSVREPRLAGAPATVTERIEPDPLSINQSQRSTAASPLRAAFDDPNRGVFQPSTPPPGGDNGSAGLGTLAGDTDDAEPETQTPAAPAGNNPAPRTDTAASPAPADDARLSVPARAADATRSAIAAAEARLAAGDKLAARELLARALRRPGLPAADHQALRARLSTLNEDLIFSKATTPNDPIAEVYTVQPGDSLERIARRQRVATHWKLIQRVNGITRPNTIRVGQKLKIVRGPFNAVVDKSDFRLDLYQGPPEMPERWTFVRSFQVGLGERTAEDPNGTPTGRYRVLNKLENPAWVNPQTNERFERDDPQNPIGEFWLALEGLGEAAVHTGYGLHGTIDPNSIGAEQSMGCIRLGDDDIALLYEMLQNGVSIVQIVD